jgi:uncharacterized protein
MAFGRKVREKAPPWYAEGLRFECQSCGRCCGGGPGYVWVDEADLREIASRLGQDAEEFRRAYVRNLWRGMSLREKSNYDCVLLDGSGRCTAYEARPVQCRNWPFWPSNLRDPSDWMEASERCPGIGIGPLFSFEYIETRREEMDK